MLRTTLGSAVARAGTALHSGRPAVAVLRPAPFGAGRIFRVPGGEVAASLANASAVPGATVLQAGAARVSTPEHLLAALAALGVTDVVVEVDGDELPALDGSAAGWVEAIDLAGRVPGPDSPDVPIGSAVVEAFGGWARIGPGASLRVEVAYDGGPAGVIAVPLTEEAFRRELAWARTFVRAADVERLRASGRGRGASAANTVLWPGGDLRAPDEPVRHKALDAWGDLALLGGPAALEVVRGSHALHLELLRTAPCPCDTSIRG